MEEGYSTPAPQPEVEFRDDKTTECIYSIKMVNPSRMSDFRNVDLGTGILYQSINSLKKFIMANLPSIPGFVKPDIDEVEMGYVEPGHGLKGKKVWLFTDGDISKMYARYQRKRNIRLWCYTHATKKDSKKKSNKTAATSGSKSTGSKSSGSKSTGSKFEKKQDEVDEVYEELRKKYKNTYSPEQLRTWSYMMKIGSHDTLDEPPEKPYFVGYKRRAKATYSPSGKSPESKRLALSTTVSPGRKVNVRSELIDQLEKWHKLLDLCVISQKEYEDLKDQIL